MTICKHSGHRGRYEKAAENDTVSRLKSKTVDSVMIHKRYGKIMRLDSRHSADTPPVLDPLAYIILADLGKRWVAERRAAVGTVFDIQQDCDAVAFGDKLRFRGVDVV